MTTIITIGMLPIAIDTQLATALLLLIAALAFKTCLELLWFAWDFIREMVDPIRGKQHQHPH